MLHNRKKKKITDVAYYYWALTIKDSFEDQWLNFGCMFESP